jgi:hypothetical protein
MTVDEIKDLIRGVLGKIQLASTADSVETVEFDEVLKFPELRETLIGLLSPEYNMFLSSVDWVSPLPTTFRINLKNDESFYLIYGTRSWIAQVEGKKYYLANLPERGRASESIASILRYGSKEKPSEDNEGFADLGGETPTETPAETPEETPPA